MLYIEDNETIVELVTLILGDRPDIRLVSAAGGVRGLALARELRPDLILLDLHLPDTALDA